MLPFQAHPVHKRFCGKVDFAWPLPDAEELAHLKAIAHEKRSDDLMDQSIADSFKRLLPQVPVEVRLLLPILSSVFLFPSLSFRSLVLSPLFALPLFSHRRAFPSSTSDLCSP
jgi:hypothetical protein